MDTDESSRAVKSVHTAFQILSTIQNRNRVTIQELSSEIGIARSTAHNHLETLRSMGYITKRSNSYQLGLRLLTHGMAARETLPGKGKIISTLEDVSEELSHPVWWIVEEQGRGIFAARAGDGEVEERGYAKVGKRSYLHTHAPGKAILAKLSEESVQSIVDQHGLPILTKKTTTDPEKLSDELDEVREKGYAFCDGEVALGIQSVGAAFTGPEERMYALGLFGYSHEFHGQRIDTDIATQLHETAKHLENSLRSAREP